MTASPETLRLVRTIHDTVHTVTHDTIHVVTRDTVVRIAEAQSSDRWVVGAAIATIFGAAATVFAAIVAWKGIKAWRNRLKRSTEYHLAIRAYRVLRRLNDRIRAARDRSKHTVRQFDPEFDRDIPAFVKHEMKEYGYFLGYVRSSWAALKDIRAEAEILWGPEFTKLMDAMDRLGAQLFENYRLYFGERARLLKSPAPDDDASARVFRKIIFDMRKRNEDVDEYGVELNAAVAAANAFLQRKIDLAK